MFISSKFFYKNGDDPYAFSYLYSKIQHNWGTLLVSNIFLIALLGIGAQSVHASSEESLAQVNAQVKKLQQEVARRERAQKGQRGKPEDKEEYSIAEVFAGIVAASISLSGIIGGYLFTNIDAASLPSCDFGRHVLVKKSHILTQVLSSLATLDGGEFKTFFGFEPKDQAERLAYITTFSQVLEYMYDSLDFWPDKDEHK